MENEPAAGWTRVLVDKRRDAWASGAAPNKKAKNVVLYRYNGKNKFLGHTEKSAETFREFLGKHSETDVTFEDFSFNYEICLTMAKSIFESPPQDVLTPNSSPSPSPSPPSAPAPVPAPPSSTNNLPIATPPGLVNLGATCYLNSLVQCLFQNVAFRRGLYQYDPNNLPDASDSKLFGILDQLQMLFTNLDRSARKRLDLKEVRQCWQFSTHKNHRHQTNSARFASLVHPSLSQLTDRLGLNTAEQQDPQGETQSRRSAMSWECDNCTRYCEERSDEL